jgi:hypothetical protein
MNRFISRHREKITGVLQCFDRVIFQGHLPINYAEALQTFLRARGVSMPDFGRFVRTQSERMRLAAEGFAARARRPCIFVGKPGRKEAWAHEIAKRDGITEGLVAILRTTEVGRSFSVLQAHYGPRIVSAPRRGLHLYFYFIDPQLGWIHIRLQTWFPFLIQIAINGHEILARQMDHAGLAYRRVENGFTWLQDPAKATAMAHRLCSWQWPRILDRIARRVNPLLNDLLKPMTYHWVTDQCEMATDLIFEDAHALEQLYSKLVRHASLCFTAEDILGFLGRRVHGLFTGDVFNEHGVRRWGVRIKHRIRNNWIKMYDKAGSILRVETVINHSQDFRIRRLLQPRRGKPHMGMGPLPKSVAYLGRYWEIQQRANAHYIDALAAVEDPTEAHEELKQLSSPVRLRQQRLRAINPLNPDDVALLAAVMRGEYHLQGFRNEHILRNLYSTVPEEPKERKRLAARVRRKLLILRAHHMIKRIPGSRRYRVTARGLRAMGAALCYSKESLADRLLDLAA